MSRKVIDDRYYNNSTFTNNTASRTPPVNTPELRKRSPAEMKSSKSNINIVEDYEQNQHHRVLSSSKNVYATPTTQKSSIVATNYLNSIASASALSNRNQTNSSVTRRKVSTRSSDKNSIDTYNKNPLSMGGKHDDDKENSTNQNHKRSDSTGKNHKSSTLNKFKAVANTTLSLMKSPEFRKRPTKVKNSGSRKHMNPPSANPEYDYPTIIHKACRLESTPNSILKRFESYYLSDDEAICDGFFEDMMKIDSNGKNVLHHISLNENILSFLTSTDSKYHHSSDERSFSESYCMHLDPCKARDVTKLITKYFLYHSFDEDNLSMILQADLNGYIPFEEVITTWIQSVHCNEIDGSNNVSVRRQQLDKFSQVANNVITKAKGTLHQVPNAIKNSSSSSLRHELNTSLDELHQNHTPEKRHSTNIEDLQSSNPLTPILDEQTGVAKVDDFDQIFPSHVMLTAQVEYVLYLISSILCHLDKDKKLTSTNHSKTQLSSPHLDELNNDETISRSGTITEHNNKIADEYISRLASIPHFLKTILLIEDENVRKNVLGTKIMERILIRKESVGKWLTSMLQVPRREVSKNAVDYLHLVSHVTDESYEKDVNRQLDELYIAVSSLDGLIPSMLGLDEGLIEEVATTSVISRVLDKMISTNFVLYLIFFDTVFLMALICIFRKSVKLILFSSPRKDVIRWIYVTNAFVYYFLIREIGKCVALSSITTRRVFWVNFFYSIWNLIDIFSIIMAITSTIVMRASLASESIDEGNVGVRAIIAVTTGLLWLRFLGILKTVNMQLATFILAIVQITRDILWFLVILLVMVLCFAQIFFTLIVPKSCATSGDIDCNAAEYYLKVYTILLGDFGLFERNDFTTVFSTILFILFTFLVTIVLLNVLIAIISDSHEKCLIRSQNLFGRARVLLLAEIVAFQDLFAHGTNSPNKLDEESSSELCCGVNWIKDIKWTKGALIFTSLSVLVSVIWIFSEYWGYTSEESYGDIKFSIGSILINLVILIILLLVLTMKTRQKKDKALDCVFEYSKPIPIIMRYLLLRTNEQQSISDANSDLKDWRGRVTYIQREMNRISQETYKKTQDMVENEIRNSENRMIHRLNTTEEGIKEQLDRLERILMSLDRSTA